MRWSRCCGLRGSLLLQCSPSSGTDFVGPEAQICFSQWAPLLTSGLWAFNVLADYTLKFFVLFTRVFHFPVEKSSASRFVKSAQKRSYSFRSARKCSLLNKVGLVKVGLVEVGLTVSPFGLQIAFSLLIEVVMPSSHSNGLFPVRHGVPPGLAIARDYISYQATSRQCGSHYTG